MKGSRRDSAAILAEIYDCLEQGKAIIDATPKTLEDTEKFVEYCLRISSLKEELMHLIDKKDCLNMIRIAFDTVFSGS